MTEVEDKLVDLKSLMAVVETIINEFDTQCIDLQEQINNIIIPYIESKLYAPKVNGTIGQVLTLKDDQGNTEWKDMSASISEANIRRIINEQLAKMKYTINDQGHLIIETPEA